MSKVSWLVEEDAGVQSSVAVANSSNLLWKNTEDSGFAIQKISKDGFGQRGRH